MKIVKTQQFEDDRLRKKMKWVTGHGRFIEIIVVGFDIG